MAEGKIDSHVWSYVKDDRAMDDQLYTQERRVEMAREKVRKIRHHEPGSPEWFQLADHLQDLSGLAKIEVYCPKIEHDWEEQKGIDTEGGTLWDQKVAESTIKVLVEDAKVAAALRLIVEMKEWQRDGGRFESDLLATTEWAGCSLVEAREKVDVFEEAMGHILCLAYEHREAMQLSDLMLTVQHVRDCLHACEVLGLSTKNSKLQETQSMFLLFSICKHIEEFNTQELLGQMQATRVLPLVVHHVSDRVRLSAARKQHRFPAHRIVQRYAVVLFRRSPFQLVRFIFC
jgi:hypothetical protein